MMYAIWSWFIFLGRVEELSALTNLTTAMAALQIINDYSDLGFNKAGTEVGLKLTMMMMIMSMTMIMVMMMMMSIKNHHHHNLPRSTRPALRSATDPEPQSSMDNQM